MKTCTKCTVTKSPEDFYKRARSPDGREAKCKVCRLAHNKAWFTRNKVRHGKLTRRWYVENRELHLANTTARYRADPSRALAQGYLRDERIKRATPPWADLESITQVYRLCKVGNSASPNQEPWEVDHIYPLHGKTVSGLHVRANLHMIPQSANRRKANKIDESYLF